MSILPVKIHESGSCEILCILGVNGVNGLLVVGLAYGILSLDEVIGRFFVGGVNGVNGAGGCLDVGCANRILGFDEVIGSFFVGCVLLVDGLDLGGVCGVRGKNGGNCVLIFFGAGGVVFFSGSFRICYVFVICGGKLFEVSSTLFGASSVICVEGSFCFSSIFGIHGVDVEGVSGVGGSWGYGVKICKIANMSYLISNNLWCGWSIKCLVVICLC